MTRILIERSAGNFLLETEVTTVTAAYIVAVSPEKPTPAQILILMQQRAMIDWQLLTSVPEFNDAACRKQQMGEGGDRP